MPEELNPNKGKKIAALLALALAAVLVGWWFLSKKPVPPPPSAASTSPKPNFKEDMVAGNMVEISLSRKIITLGGYKVENGKAELISKRDIAFNDSTKFVRLERAADGKQKETVITAENVKVNDVVNAFLSAASATASAGSAASNPPVAQRIAILTALFPKAR